MRTAAVGLVVAVTAAAACSSFLSPRDRVCAAIFVFGLDVRVQDSVTAAGIGSGSTLVTIDDHGVIDSVSFPPNRPDLNGATLAAAGEHAGTFTVIVRHAGYADWARTGVRVTRNECHVNPVALTAMMRPL